MGLLRVTVDNLVQAAVADQQAERPRAKWVATLSFRQRAPIGGRAVSSVRSTPVAPPVAVDGVSWDLLTLPAGSRV